MKIKIIGKSRRAGTDKRTGGGKKWIEKRRFLQYSIGI